ncbi:MAG: DNA mismatch repair endonuclease MutL [Candidatus Omnitrophota bacterium]
MPNSKINILSEELIGKISAGEVVERPASVVKELIENSIDSSASSIEIELKSSGHSLIRVADNGEGMTPQDAEIACRQHATSKIHGAEDLDNISTLGFRGEALASIAAVSQMDLITNTGSSDAGVYLYIESGEILKTRPAARAQGTTIEARNLFYNVPARRKFLKKESSELSEIVNVVGRFIVSYPDIEFKLTQLGRVLLRASREMDSIERVKLILGADIADHLVGISGNNDNYVITGYVSRPSYTRKDRKGQLFFVNSRFIRNKFLNDVIYGAYRSLLERGRYPAAVLFLNVSPLDVDVNVHPAKLEVKFSEEEKIRKLIESAIKSTFEGPQEKGIFSIAGTSVDKPEESLIQTEFTYNIKKGDSALFPGLSITKKMGAVPFFQIGNCYIVRVKPDGIIIVDQHAAHERIFYEFFTKAAGGKQVEVQNLLFPVRMDLSASETIIMEKLYSKFRDIGFHIESFGEKSFIVQAVPAVLRERDVKPVICDILADLDEYNLDKPDLMDELVKVASCRAAVKAGDVLTDEEMVSLLEQLDKCYLPFTCPHGRPTMIEITPDELEKRFRRK